MQVFLVGGAVRDELLDLPAGDRDWVVVGATGEQLLARGFVQRDPRFPVFIHPDSGEEYALARRERKVADGHQGFAVDCAPHVTLAEDLARRDLTVNAMARSLAGALVDPFNGLDDLRARRLRHVSPAFVEDPLRVLRCARFAAQLGVRNFQVVPETLALLTRMSASGEVATLSAERRWYEARRAMGSHTPRAYLRVLDACGGLSALGVTEAAPVRALESVLPALCLALDEAQARTATALIWLTMVHGADHAGELAAVLGTPPAVREGSALAAELAQRAGAPERPSGRELLLALGSADALRRPHRLLEALTWLRGLAPVWPPAGRAAARLENARTAAVACTAAPFAARGLHGRALGEALAQARAAAIDAAATD